MRAAPRTRQPRRADRGSSRRRQARRDSRPIPRIMVVAPHGLAGRVSMLSARAWGVGLDRDRGHASRAPQGNRPSSLPLVPGRGRWRPVGHVRARQHADPPGVPVRVRHVPDLSRAGRRQPGRRGDEPDDPAADRHRTRPGGRPAAGTLAAPGRGPAGPDRGVGVGGGAPPRVPQHALAGGRAGSLGRVHVLRSRRPRSVLPLPGVPGPRARCRRRRRAPRQRGTSAGLGPDSRPPDIPRPECVRFPSAGGGGAARSRTRRSACRAYVGHLVPQREVGPRETQVIGVQTVADRSDGA